MSESRTAVIHAGSNEQHMMSLVVPERSLYEGICQRFLGISDRFCSKPEFFETTVAALKSIQAIQEGARPHQSHWLPPPIRLFLPNGIEMLTPMNDGKQGYRSRRVGEVATELRLVMQIEGFSLESLCDEFWDYRQKRMVYGKDRLWPQTWSAIACYAVRGGSEGHYVHIEANQPRGHFVPLMHMKTFGGEEMALRMANRCTQLLTLSV